MDQMNPVLRGDGQTLNTRDSSNYSAPAMLHLIPECYHGSLEFSCWNWWSVMLPGIVGQGDEWRQALRRIPRNAGI